MGYLLAASVGLFLLYFLARAIGRTDVRALASAGRWIGGGIAVFLGVILSIGGRAGIGSMLAFGGVALLRQAWQQRNNTKPIGSDTVSTVRSRFIRMQMDHDTGEVWGEIISGHMAGTDLDALDEAGTRRFVEEITGDADSVSLLETYLDANRAGWRDYFEGQTQAGGGGGSSGASASGPLDTAQALEILGLEAGATPEQIREAHRSLMKRVHPDAGGSTFLAAKINEAKDFLLAQRK